MSLETALADVVRALGWTLIHTLWQGALVAAAYAAFRLLVRGRDVRVRYTGGLLALLLMLVLPAATLFVLLGAPTGAASLADAGAAVAGAGGWAARVDAWLPVVVLAWGLGVLAMGAREAWRFRAVRALLLGSAVDLDDWTARAARIRRPAAREPSGARGVLDPGAHAEPGRLAAPGGGAAGERAAGAVAAPVGDGDRARTGARQPRRLPGEPDAGRRRNPAVPPPGRALGLARRARAARGLLRRPRAAQRRRPAALRRHPGQPGGTARLHPRARTGRHRRQPAAARAAHRRRRHRGDAVAGGRTGRGTVRRFAGAGCAACRPGSGERGPRQRAHADRRARPERGLEPGGKPAGGRAGGGSSPADDRRAPARGGNRGRSRCRPQRRRRRSAARRRRSR